MKPSFRLFGDFVEIAADSLTVALSLAAIYGFIKNRKKLSLMAKLYLNNHFNQRAKKMRENLDRLSCLDYNEKSNRPEIIRLLHAIRGQMRPWLEHKSSFNSTYERIDDVLNKKIKISEGQKSEIIHEIEEVLESLFLNDSVSDVTKEKKNEQ